ncbi:hypothetical protein FF100_14015 [Methylobacterium terricola]|uniref:Uncharacterized protein n=1 Tax=Methylobacterium terricola TaxID=2583531 RepID=A0A5C4LHZ7_9HYPH|nr:hypothetical protein [Methylobacterium terricola]TNC12775.1 hypothetical protein FF100_14015 [Methylobacterium terricola]
MVRRLILPLAALTCLSGPVLAQSPLPVRVRPPVAVEPDIYDRAAAPGPVVLQVSPDLTVGPMPLGPTGLVAIRAVPVAAVTNGGAFGPTGFGYYGDSVSEGPLNRPRRMADYVLGNRAY